MSLAFLFPGQGAQRPGFLDALPDHPAARATLDEASRVLGRDVRTMDDGNALASTVCVQLATVVAGVALARALAAEGVVPEAVAGLSVGSFAAAIVAGAIGFADALALVRLRGTLMERAYPSGYGMAALVGLDQPSVERLIEAARVRGGELHLANLNAPLEFVLAGDDASLGAAIAAARLVAGARKAERLAVAVPSHCSLLAGVARELERALDAVAVAAPIRTYVGNRRARALRDAISVREELATNLACPVRWHEATTLLGELGTRLFLEMPPGDVLTRLADAAFPDARAKALDGASLAAARALAEKQTA